MKGFSRISGHPLGMLSLSMVLSACFPSTRALIPPAARSLLQQSNPQAAVLGRANHSPGTPIEHAESRVLIWRRIQPLEGDGATRDNAASGAEVPLQVGCAAVVSRSTVRKRPRLEGRNKPPSAPGSFMKGS